MAGRGYWQESGERDNGRKGLLAKEQIFGRRESVKTESKDGEQGLGLYCLRSFSTAQIRRRKDHPCRMLDAWRFETG